MNDEPSLEDQVRKAASDFDAARRAAFKEPQPRPVVGRQDLGSTFRGGDVNKAERALPTASTIVEKLKRTLDRLRDVEARAVSAATVLAGPGAPLSIAQPGEQQPAASLFVIYERTLDEIDRIIDNIEGEQARTRSILGE